MNSISHPDSNRQDAIDQLHEFFKWAYVDLDPNSHEGLMWFFVNRPHADIYGYFNGSAVISSREGIYTHEEAYDLIGKLLMFYDHVSPETITLLNEYRNSAPTPSHNQPKTKKIYPGFVYLIQQVNGQHYKIGKSITPDKRMSLFEVKLPFPIERICTIETDDMSGLERELHETFANKRVDGEWFALDTEDVEYIKSLAGVE